KIEHRSFELIGGQLQPRRNAAAAGRFDGLTDLTVLATLFANLDDIALAHLVRGDIDLLSVDLDVSMPDQLPPLSARRCESERIDDVVEAQLELPEQIVAGDAVLFSGPSEVQTELPFQQAVNALHFLLFAKLQTISQDFGTAAAMLAGRIVPA